MIFRRGIFHQASYLLDTAWVILGVMGLAVVLLIVVSLARASRPRAAASVEVMGSWAYARPVPASEQGPPLVTEDRGARSGARIEELVRTDLVALGRFSCPPGDPLWTAENYIGEHAHVAFPRVPVRIALKGRADVVSDVTLALCYAPRQRFRREALTPRGDECVFAVLDGALFEQIGPEPFRALPADAFLRVHALQDPLALEELIVGLSDAPAPRATRWGERVKEMLAARLGERLTLAELARELGTSPYHLARSFKAATGSSIHQYRLQLRVRTAMLRLREDVDLCTLGLELGFATHSHFTETFRRAFGAPPRAVRELLSARFR